MTILSIGIVVLIVIAFVAISIEIKGLYTDGKMRKLHDEGKITLKELLNYRDGSK